MEETEDPFRYAYSPIKDLGDFAKDLSGYATTATGKQSASELTITIKNEEKRQITKHLLYEVYTVSDEDILIKSLIAQALQEFNAEPEDIRIRINLTVL